MMVYKVGMIIMHFCTHVSNVLPNSLSLHQRSDPEAVVPVATAEEQLAIMGDHKQRCCDLHAWGKWFGQKFLGSCMKTGGKTVHTKNEAGQRAQNNCIHFAYVLFSLGVGHCGVFNESEVVGDVLVVREPPMGPNQAVLTNCHLNGREKQYF